MQLKSSHIASTLGMLAANLLAAAPAMAQDAEANPASPEVSSPAATDKTVNAWDETASEIGTIVVDSALLLYNEDNGRVRAVEPETSVVYNSNSGAVYSGKFTYDSLTGASPNGATRATVPQTFIAPIVVGGEGGSEGGSDSSTGASGSYTIPAGQLPMDTGFKDHREAIDLGMTAPIADNAKLSIGTSASWETDYTSYSARLGFTRDFNNKNTTLALSGNFALDKSTPFYGIPVPLGSMGDSTVGTSRTKKVLSFVAGVTQVLTPNWLVQLNYSFGTSKGYQTDPYKLVSLVDSTQGAPFWYIYESRPEKRLRHSVYLGTKLALGSLVTDASVRYYHDSWGIDSFTGEISERVPLGRSFFIEPGGRYYRQTAAKFFRHYLTLEEPTPQYVSADSRLGKFSAVTFSLKAGAKLTDNIELYAGAERYRQSGKRFDATAPGDLAHLDLFGGMKATSIITGIKVTFR